MMEGDQAMQEAMIEAVIFVKELPEAYIRNKIIPKLRRHKINIRQILTPRTKEVDLSKVSYILLLNESMGHSNTEKLGKLAKKYGVKIVCLSRKEAFWGEHLKYVH